MALHPAVETHPSGDGGVRGVAEFTPEPEHRGNPGWLHGGMAATVLDHVAARTAAAVLDSRVVTAKLELRYRQPVELTGGPYRVEAEASPPRRGTVRVAVALVGSANKPLVQAKALFTRRPR